CALSSFNEKYQCPERANVRLEISPATQVSGKRCSSKSRMLRLSAETLRISVVAALGARIVKRSSDIGGFYVKRPVLTPFAPIDAAKRMSLSTVGRANISTKGHDSFGLAARLLGPLRRVA